MHCLETFKILKYSPIYSTTAVTFMLWLETYQATLVNVCYRETAYNSNCYNGKLYVICNIKLLCTVLVIMGFVNIWTQLPPSSEFRPQTNDFNLITGKTSPFCMKDMNSPIASRVSAIQPQRAWFMNSNHRLVIKSPYQLKSTTHLWVFIGNFKWGPRWILLHESRRVWVAFMKGFYWIGSQGLR